MIKKSVELPKLVTSPDPFEFISIQKALTTVIDEDIRVIEVGFDFKSRNYIGIVHDVGSPVSRELLREMMKSRFGHDDTSGGAKLSDHLIWGELNE